MKVVVLVFVRVPELQAAEPEGIAVRLVDPSALPQEPFTTDGQRLLVQVGELVPPYCPLQRQRQLDAVSDTFV